MSKEVQNNVQMFKKVYNEILAECIVRRKAANFSQQLISELLNTNRRKIIDLEQGKISVGLLLNYADLLDIEIKLNYKFY
jgi:transcriptional regulator with XRE-family HTH domain